MPGIVGLVTRKPRQVAESELRRMISTFPGEPLESQGVWVDEEIGVYVGWSVRKGAFADVLPIVNERRDVVLFFSGEKFSGNRDRSAPASAWTSTRSDVRKLSRASIRGKWIHPDHVNGRFHGLIVDRAAQTATLFNDRYGMYRMYYHEAGHAVYFSGTRERFWQFDLSAEKLTLKVWASSSRAGVSSKTVPFSELCTYYPVLQVGPSATARYSRKMFILSPESGRTSQN